MKLEVLLLFFVGRMSGHGAEDFCLETKSSILHDHVLVGHVITSLVTRGFLSCAQRCLSMSPCSSFNYQTSAVRDGICELNNNEDGAVRSKVTPKHGFAFGQIQRKEVRILNYSDQHRLKRKQYSLGQFSPALVFISFFFCKRDFTALFAMYNKHIYRVSYWPSWKYRVYEINFVVIKSFNLLSIQ